MSPGEWIALAALVIPSMFAIGGFIWWMARRDAQTDATIEAVKGLKVAVEHQTMATNEATTAINGMKDEFAEYKQKIAKEHEAIWNKLDWVQDKIINRGDG